MTMHILFDQTFIHLSIYTSFNISFINFHICVLFIYLYISYYIGVLFSAKYVISILNGIFNRLFRGGKNIKKTFGSWGMDGWMYNNDASRHEKMLMMMMNLMMSMIW